MESLVNLYSKFSIKFGSVIGLGLVYYGLSQPTEKVPLELAFVTLLAGAVLGQIKPLAPFILPAVGICYYRMQ